jgi:hypothetical protein
MSYVVEIVRPISKAEVVALASTDSELSIVAEGDEWADLIWKRGSAQALFSFAQSRITLTTPDDVVLEKAQGIAAKLGARVVGEEDQLRAPAVAGRGAHVRSSWAGWPFLVAVLLVLLLWRW